MKKSIERCLVLMTLFVLVVCGCDKKEEPVKSFGPAGKLVQSFFKNWEFERYQEMHAQTVHSRREEFFVKFMQETPIEWKNMVILSEEPYGDDWKVTLSVDVTDVACALAACRLNAKIPSAPGSSLPDFAMTPRFLGIQKFMPIKQVWRVINLDGKYFIDICAAESKGERHENIMNYVLDASDMDSVLPIPEGASSEDKEALVVTAWLTKIVMDFNIPMENMPEYLGGVVSNSLVLANEAVKNIAELIEKRKPMGGE